MFRAATLAAAFLALAHPPARADALAIVGFGYSDTSHEPRDQSAVHARRVRDFMQALAQDLSAKAGKVVTIACAAPCTAPPAVPDALAEAAKAGAGKLLIGGFHKESTLVQWAKVTLIDVPTRRVMLDKLFTFRGDTDQAWRHAETFIAGDIGDALPVHAETAARPVDRSMPIRIAVFPFEYSDFSADAGPDLTRRADRGYVQSVTDAVRQAMARSGRYIVVDAGRIPADQTYYDCGGCDAAIALRLGADQALTGIVRRISRTEYTIGFRIRNAHSGAILDDTQSGLRIGADYSWKIGATLLIRQRLLSDGK